MRYFFLAIVLLTSLFATEGTRSYRFDGVAPSGTTVEIRNWNPVKGSCELRTTLYADKALLTPLSNPFISGSTGHFSFFIARPGGYCMTYRDGNRTTSSTLFGMSIPEK